MNWYRRLKERYYLYKNRRNAPNTLEEAVERLKIDFKDNEDVKTWIKLPEAKATGLAHFGIGMWIRNNWGLWMEGHPLQLYFRTVLEIWHADDMSSIILTCFHREMNGKIWELERQVEKYKKFWAEKDNVVG